MPPVQKGWVGLYWDGVSVIERKEFDPVDIYAYKLCWAEQESETGSDSH